VSKIGEPSLVAILAAAGRCELQVMHDVVAMLRVERVAFFAARSQRADASMQTTGA
jgi:hypothetical protein